MEENYCFVLRITQPCLLLAPKLCFTLSILSVSLINAYNFLQHTEKKWTISVWADTKQEDMHTTMWWLKESLRTEDVFTSKLLHSTVTYHLICRRALTRDAPSEGHVAATQHSRCATCQDREAFPGQISV